MIIDRASFIDLATLLEAASKEHLDLTRALVEFAESGQTAESHNFVAVVNHLAGLSGALSGLEQILRALLEANREEGRFRHKKPIA
jgi:hypothetical protein